MTSVSNIQISYVDPVWLNVLGVGAASGYLLSMWLISRRLKLVHKSIYDELLRPFSFDLNSVFSSIKLMVYVLGTQKYKSVSDAKLATLIQVTRLLVVAMFIIVYLGAEIGHPARIELGS